MMITVGLLRSKNACKSQIDLFEKFFPNGTEVTCELCIKHAKDFNFQWAADNLLSKSQYSDYISKTAPIQADYISKTAPIQADYIYKIAKTAPIQADYIYKIAPIEADYLAKRTPIEADYLAKMTSIWADYKAKLAVLFAEISNS